jgi:hypothetical protein
MYDAHVHQIQCRFLLFARRAEPTPPPVIHLNIMGIFSHVTAKREPVDCPVDDFCVVSFWKGPRQTRAVFTLRISGPHGFAYSTEGDVTFTVDETAYVIGTFEDLQFPHFGDYQFEIVFDEDVHVSETLPLMPEI